MQLQTGLPSKSNSGEGLEDVGLEGNPFIKDKLFETIL
jgi:hypothetical protein